MSNIQNEKWAEAAWENLQEALEDGDWPLAEAVIKDTREKFSDTEANKMRKALFSAQEEYAKEEVTFVPFNHVDLELTEEERVSWGLPKVGPSTEGEWTQEGDEKFPVSL